MGKLKMLSPELEKTFHDVKMQLMFNRNAAAFYIPFSYLPIHETMNVKTFKTDGRQILINPEFYSTLPKEHVAGIFFHEIMHNVLGHTCSNFPKVQRIDLMDIACEIAVNNIVLDCGLTIPEDGYIDRSYSEWSTLAIYKDLLDKAEKDPQNDPANQQQEACGCCTGECDAGISEEELGEKPDQGKMLQKLSEVQGELKKIGNNSNLLKLIDKLVESTAIPIIEFEDELKDAFHRSFDGSTPDLSNPVTQYMPKVYIPKYKDECIENLFIALDLSSSLSAKELGKAQKVIDEIRQLYEIDTTTIVTYNTRIIQRADYEQYAKIDITLMKGTGGTRGDCVFEMLKRNGETPFALLMITDTEDFIQTDPLDVNFPVIWLNTSNNEAFRHTKVPEFGRIISV